MVSNLDLVSMIFALSLFNNYLATSAKCSGGGTINVHRNYAGFCIESALKKFFELWQLINALHLDFTSEQEDCITWTLESSGEYSTSSAYTIQFNDQINSNLKTYLEGLGHVAEPPNLMPSQVYLSFIRH
jgi:hypothetical protein